MPEKKARFRGNTNEPIKAITINDRNRPNAVFIERKNLTIALIKIN